MNKLKMSHDYFMKHVNTDDYKDVPDNTLQEWAWQYADAMQAEADKREKEEAENKRKEMRELLNANNTFVEKEGQHFDDVEWQPDWDELPSNANYFAMDESGMCNAYENKPEICDDQWDFGNAICECDSFGYTGDWRDSLRKRPQ